MRFILPHETEWFHFRTVDIYKKHFNWESFLMKYNIPNLVIDNNSSDDDEE